MQLPPTKLDSSTTTAAPSAVPVTIAMGDGIGPEIMRATLRILEAAGVAILPETIEVGLKAYEAGHSSGISPEGWESLRRTKVFLKAPVMTPQGGGFKSLNVTVRKSLGLFANVRPCVTYHPFVTSLHPRMDVTIIRENEEDLYAGIEHRQTDEVMQCLKLITRPGCERIARYAFEYARAHGRKKVTCMTKDNIMKMTDGLFHKVFDEMASQYSDVVAEHLIVDIGAARLAADPGRFDVLLLPNLYGDILSDVAAEIAGSVGLAPSSNLGEHGAMFEAIHGSAPDIAGKDVANPSGLLLAAVMMLVHLRLPEAAESLQNAWLTAVERGARTADMHPAQPSQSAKVLGTQEFADAVIACLGQQPEVLRPARLRGAPEMPPIAPYIRRQSAKTETVGLDVFVAFPGDTADVAAMLQSAEGEGLKLIMVTNRGVKVWPQGFPETFLTDHWRCRYTGNGDARALLRLQGRILDAGLEVVKTEGLRNYDGIAGYSAGQGQ